jgi:hypothetical protein
MNAEILAVGTEILLGGVAPSPSLKGGALSFRRCCGSTAQLPSTQLAGPKGVLTWRPLST